MSKKLLTTTGLAVAMALFLVVNILAGTTLRRARIDLTQNRLYTLSEGTRNVLKNLGEDITLRFYFSKKLAQDEAPSVSAYGKRVQELLEEFAANSDHIKLIVAEPEPFSEEEDRAVSYGLQGAPANRAGDPLYFGLAATNSTDDTETIPFFSDAREEFLEYDVTQLIYKLGEPNRPVVGLITRLPMQGGPPSNPFMQQGGTDPWTIVDQIDQLFDLRTIPWESDKIDDDVKVLMIVHPKDLPEKTLYAVDQFVMRGGHALVFVDPFCEADTPPRDPQNPMSGLNAKRGSDLAPLLAAWGVSFKTEDTLADRGRALRVGAQNGQGVDFVVWAGLRRDKDDFDTQDAVTAQLNLVHVASAGILSKADGATTDFRPLLSSSDDSMRIKSQTLAFQQIAPDPASLLDGFAPEGQRLTVAARISGPAHSAYPNGNPTAADKKDDKAQDKAGADEKPAEGEPKDTDAAPEQEHLAESKGPINVIVVADADMLTDRFWVRVQNFLGSHLAMPFADNGDFVINALENLSGSNDLISLRSRGRFQRPFDRVIELRREAEARFREKEKELEAKLHDTEQELANLQQGKEGAEKLILSPEQQQKIQEFREQRMRTRKELRDVKHQLNKDIEGLGTRLKLADVLGVPLAVALIGLGSFAFRSSRRKS
jgi:gliding motility-associatede transport system auxiliary component